MSEDSVAYVCEMVRKRRRHMTSVEMLHDGWHYTEHAKRGSVTVLYTCPHMPCERHGVTTPAAKSMTCHQGYGNANDSITAHRRAIEDAWRRVEAKSA